MVNYLASILHIILFTLYNKKNPLICCVLLKLLIKWFVSMDTNVYSITNITQVCSLNSLANTPYGSNEKKNPISKVCKRMKNDLSFWEIPNQTGRNPVFQKDFTTYHTQSTQIHTIYTDEEEESTNDKVWVSSPKHIETFSKLELCDKTEIGSSFIYIYIYI